MMEGNLEELRMASGHTSSEAEEETSERSAEDMRQQLYRSLQAKGVLTQLKSQLRCRLVQELRGGSHDADTPPVPLVLQIANSIVAEHLRGCGYQYTLSTFLPESDTDINKLFSREDILQYLHIQPPHPLHSTLSNNNRGFLRDLLDSLSSLSVGVASGDHTHSTGVQTEEKREEEKRGVVSLEDKLRVLDEEHVAQLAEEDVEGGEEGGGKDRGGVKEEQRRREYEEELRKEVERKMEEFREVESIRVREEERQHCEADLRNLRIAQEETHRKKMESLRRLEMDSSSSLRSKQLEVEAALFAKRQELETQLQTVWRREDILRREMEEKQQTLQLAEQRLIMAGEELSKREREVERYRTQMEGVVRGELANWETNLRAEQSRQEAVKTELEQARRGMREEREKREEVEATLHETSKQLVQLQRQREEALISLQKMSDYGSLKQQLSEVKTHLVKTERRLSENRTEHRRMQAEQQEIIKGLRKQLGRPRNDQLKVAEEVEKIKRDLELKLLASEEEKRQLRQEISRQTALLTKQRNQLEEQTLGLREMEREVRDLTTQLTGWQASILHSRTKPVKTHGTRQIPSPPPPPPHHHQRPTPSPPYTTLSPHPHPPLSSSSPDLLYKTRETFHKLEQEGVQLQQHFFKHHKTLPNQTPPISLSEGVAYWPVGVVTAASSAPTTHLTTVTKSTPSPMLTSSIKPNITSTSFPSTKATPTNILTPPSNLAAPPTTITPTISLDQLWKKSALTGSETTTLSQSPLSSPPTPIPSTTTATALLPHISTTVPLPPSSTVPLPPSSTVPLPPSSTVTTTTTSCRHLSPTTPQVASHLPVSSAVQSVSYLPSSEPHDGGGGGGVGGVGEKGMEPLMLKYMELLSEKKEEKKEEEEERSETASTPQNPSISEHINDVNETKSLSQATDSIGGYSEGDKSSDPFKDW